MPSQIQWHLAASHFLSSRFGIGDLGLEAYRFVDFLAQSAQHL